MPDQASSILLDFRLDSSPSDEDVENFVVRSIEAFLGTELVSITIKGEDQDKKSKTFCLSAKAKDIFVLIRVYEREKEEEEEKVLMTVTLEMPGGCESNNLGPRTNPDSSSNVKRSSSFQDHQMTSFQLQNTELTSLQGDIGKSLREKWEMGDLFLDQILASEIGRHFPGCKSSSLPTIKRCTPNNTYLRTSDGRLLEFAFRSCLFSRRTPYQMVEILDTEDFGRLLILDGINNMSEVDRVGYTHALMNLPHEDYKDKEVLILGGGDGGLITELLELEHPPAFVTMVEIDEVVMEACCEFMPDVGGKYLAKENREGPRHRIVTGNAAEFVKEALSSGKHYDYIFGDLTDFPVEPTSEKEKDTSHPNSNKDDNDTDKKKDQKEDTEEDKDKEESKEVDKKKDNEEDNDKEEDKEDDNDKEKEEEDKDKTEEEDEDKSQWDFHRSVISQGIQLLSPGGKFMTHCNGKNDLEAIVDFERMLLEDVPGCMFERGESYVPSFMEVWMFYRIAKVE